MKGSTNAKPSHLAIYRASIDNGQKLSEAWSGKALTVTRRDEAYDVSTFTPHTNGVIVKKNGIYQISVGLGLRGGNETSQTMILAITHLRGLTTLANQDIRSNSMIYDSGVSETMVIYANADDRIEVRMTGSSTAIQTNFAPDESYLNVVYLGVS